MQADFALARATALLLIVLPIAVTGCLRPVRTEVQHDGFTKVVLLAEKRAFWSVDLELEHPIDLDEGVLTNVLSRIDKVGSDGKPTPAIPLEALSPTALGMKRGLLQADSSHKVLAQVILGGNRPHVPDEHRLTSLICYVSDDRLHIHLSHKDWTLTGEGLPETRVGEPPLGFRLVAGEGIELVNPQAVSVDWSNSVFQKPTRFRIGPGGRLQPL